MKAGNASRIAAAIRTQGIDASFVPQIIAAAFAYAARTPATAADNAIGFWRQNIETNANAIISEIGEQLVFNVSLTAAIAKESYVQRVKNFWTPSAESVAYVAEWTPQIWGAYREVAAIIRGELGVPTVPDGE